MKPLLLSLLAAASMASETLTLTGLDAEIRKREAALTEVMDVMRKAFSCGNDVDDLLVKVKETQQKLQEARLRKDRDAVAKCEADLKKLQAQKAELEKPLIKGATPELLAADINQLKKEKLELEAQRDALLEYQAKPKQP